MSAMMASSQLITSDNYERNYLTITFEMQLIDSPKYFKQMSLKLSHGIKTVGQVT